MIMNERLDHLSSKLVMRRWMEYKWKINIPSIRHNMRRKEKIIIAWSGGKDAALALYV